MVILAMEMFLLERPSGGVTVYNAGGYTTRLQRHRFMVCAISVYRQQFDVSCSTYSGFLYCLSFQPVLHDWCNKGCGMCYPVCGMVHIKEPLLLIGKSSLCGGSGFPLSLSEWSLTICLTPYNRR